MPNAFYDVSSVCFLEFFASRFFIRKRYLATSSQVLNDVLEGIFGLFIADLESFDTIGVLSERDGEFAMRRQLSKLQTTGQRMIFTAREVE